MLKNVFCCLFFLSVLVIPYYTDAAENFTVVGFVVPAGREKTVWEKPIDAAGDPLAYLVVRGSFPGAHIYSLTQQEGAGGYRTKLSVEFSDSNPPFVVGAFRGATPITEVDFAASILEEWIDGFLAVAPIWLRTGVGPDQVPIEDFAHHKPEAKIDALCCDDKSCEPVRQKFDIVFDTGEIDLTSVLTSVRQTASLGPEMETVAGHSSLWQNLLCAFFGGMILNIMPCVLPVIGLKIVSFFEQAGKRRRRAFYLNLCYAAGILSVFTALALMSVGLSYLFTYGAFQIVMGCIVFVMALNLMGIWEIELPGFLGGRKSGDLMKKEGGLGGWFKGVITTLLAIPCGAPLLSPALVWTDTLIKNGSIVPVMLIYWVIGLGMAVPFLVIGAFPELLKFLPKPGEWMETFKKVMGFVLLPAVIWILYSMPLPLILPMTLLLATLWFVCWYLGRNQFDLDRKRFRPRLLSLVIIAVTVLFSFRLPVLDRGRSYPLPTLQGAFQEKLVRWAVRASRSGELAETDWRLFDQEEFDRQLALGRTVAIDFTADWCMNCKVLETAVLRAPEIESLFREKGIVTMTGDWTNRGGPEESQIGAFLNRFGGEQVPVLMIFTPQNPEKPTVLRGLFTRETLVQTLKSL